MLDRNEINFVFFEKEELYRLFVMGFASIWKVKRSSQSLFLNSWKWPSPKSQKKNN